jgi:ribonucleotide reductase beta subunit family protein with ferritin-like domain
MAVVKSELCEQGGDSNVTDESTATHVDDRDLEERARPYRALYEHWEANQWSPLEIDYTEDRASYLRLDPDQRQGFVWIFAHRFHAEFQVATILAPFVMRAPSYELQVCLATQLSDEFRHMQSVRRVYDEVFGISSMERVKEIADANIDPVAATLYEHLDALVAPLERSDDEDDFLRASVAYHLIAEGVVARTAQNLAAGQYERQGSFPGLTTGQRLVARDEARHIGIGVSYARQRMAGDREHAREVIGEVVELFASLSTSLLETALAGGMDSQVLHGYGVAPEGFYAEAMRLWQIRLRSIGFLED